MNLYGLLWESCDTEVLFERYHLAKTLLHLKVVVFLICGWLCMNYIAVLKSEKITNVACGKSHSLVATGKNSQQFLNRFKTMYPFA